MQNPLTFNKITDEFDKGLAEVIPQIKTLSKNSLKRVLMKLLSYPIKEEEVVLLDMQETQVFRLSCDIEKLKVAMALESLGIDTQELHKQVDQPIDNLNQEEK